MPLSLRRLVASFLSQLKIRLYFDGLLLEARDVTGSPQGSNWPIYIQLKTGVGPFKRYLYLIGKSETALCPCGSGAQQTSLHIIMHCARYRALRSEHLRRRVQPFNATTLFCTNVGKKALLEFLQVNFTGRWLCELLVGLSRLAR